MKCMHPEPRAYCKRRDGCNDCDDLRNPAPVIQSASNAGLSATVELSRLLDAAEQAVNNPDSKAAQTVLKLAVAFYRDKGI